MAKSRYRGKNQHREVHPKIFIWSHTQKAEIEYFQDFKNHLRTSLLVAKKEVCWTLQELLEKVIWWKKRNVFKEDGDQAWCIFDIDDFYKKEQSKKEFLKLIESAKNNDVRIAYTNECFELWVLLHFEKPTSSICRGKNIENRIQ